MRIDREHARNLGLAILGGLLLRWSFGLHPLWRLAWIAPAPLLVAVLRSRRWTASSLALLAGLIASSADLHYFTLVMPMPMALLNVTLLAHVPAAGRAGTWYARGGDWFGWLCTAAALLLAVRVRINPRRTPRPSAAEC